MGFLTCTRNPGSVLSLVAETKTFHNDATFMETGLRFQPTVKPIEFILCGGRKRLYRRTVLRTVWSVPRASLINLKKEEYTGTPWQCLLYSLEQTSNFETRPWKSMRNMWHAGCTEGLGGQTRDPARGNQISLVRKKASTSSAIDKRDKI